MKYQSKKDETIYAAFDFEDEKCKTTRLIYLTGEKEGKSFVVSNSTLKRWWRKVEDDNPLNIDMEEVNKPYKPDVTPHYIPKPKSVIEYEAKKAQKKYNTNLPTFESLVDDLGHICSKVNETSKYVKFKDGSTLWRKSGYIDVYATEDLWRVLTEAGFQSKVNKDKVRPFAFHIVESDEFKRFEEALCNEYNA